MRMRHAGISPIHLMEAERRRKQLDFDAAARFGIGCREIDRDDIEAAADLSPGGLGEAFQEDVREPAEQFLFMLVDGELRGNDVPAGPCLHFDETQRIAVPTDKVDIAGEPGRPPLPRNDDVTALAQVKECLFLAAKTGHQMGWQARGDRLRSGAAGEFVDPQQETLLKSWPVAYLV